MSGTLFDSGADPDPIQESLARQSFLLRGFALAGEQAILDAVRRVATLAPFRNMMTPGGYRMSVAMTNCGSLGWITDRKGYRYEPLDPESGQQWPAMPPALMQLAKEAARQTGFAGFVPDACLMNRYQPGSRLTLHQDRDERDFAQPIVSVSLGLPAIFLFGGEKRADKVARIPLRHGDVVAWGGVDRLRYHGVAPLKPGIHASLGSCRVNLTFRKAG